MSEAVILFDGVCNLCNASVMFVIKHDPGARFSFAALQGEAGGRLAREWGVNPDDVSTLVLVADGRCFTRSTAALHIAHDLGFPWFLLWVLALAPAALRDRVYDFVANRRYRWFGRRDSCPLPTPELRARFLD
jgi:predicted DCC family thiol-disulfide oxidoreductase YuxK